MTVQLGLLGHGIALSLTPPLQKILGELNGIIVEYPSFDHDATFAPKIAEFLSECEANGRTGINVTHPFKEVMCAHIEPDPMVAAIGATNTVCFLPNGTRSAHNTDCTGLQEALRPIRPGAGFGVVAQLGTGGFGRAAAFALAELGVDELRLFDPIAEKAHELATRVSQHTHLTPVVATTVDELCDGASGVVNCSPIGMHHHPGNPVAARNLKNAAWVFDAVYIPMQTEFLQMAGSLNIVCVSGVELFFWQAIHAFQHFTGITLPPEHIAIARQRIWPEVERRAVSGE
jgi:shikimate dehydrogenase